MLRSGYSNRTVLRELSTRRLADHFDAESEAQLVRVGANESLLSALRSGQYQASATQIAATRTKLAAVKEENAAAAGATPGTNQSSAPIQPSQSEPPPDAIWSRLKGDLIYLHQGSLVPFDDSVLEQKKFYLLFFSANWSPDGRKFTANLIDFYNRVAAQHPELEVIFFSADRSQFGMESYMTQSAMPWPAVAYDKLSGKAGDMQKGLVHEIPTLVLADATGRILSYSHSGENAVDGAEVLRETGRVLSEVGKKANR